MAFAERDATFERRDWDSSEGTILLESRPTGPTGGPIPIQSVAWEDGVSGSRTASLVVAWGLIATAGCALHRPGPPPILEDGTLIQGQLIFHCDFGLPRQHRLVQELVVQREDVAELLDLPVSDEPIHVYLFESPEVFESFIRRRYPQLPKRRAFFVETDTELLVYAHWGNRVAEDLRHEVAHGYLHAVVPNLPLWLDEGLAEFLEVPRGARGLNGPHVTLLVDELRRNQWKPDLIRLEQLTSAAEMTQRDYAESWAWIHFLLETTPARRKLVQAHLGRLRTERSVPPLSQVLSGLEAPPGELLEAHLMVLSSAQAAARAPR